MSGRSDEPTATATPAEPAATRGAERRHHDRVSLRFPVDVFISADRVVRGIALNLSVSGALLGLPCSLPLGHEVRLRLELTDGDAPLELRAMVVRKMPSGSASTVRFGVHFILPRGEAARRLRRLVFS
ncbi:MAG: PilZ domain-containing protein [Acidobacteriota bacterium]|nr:MAG: PilZ domain-containing protein [Acidobacteriota bacterium]